MKIFINFFLILSFIILLSSPGYCNSFAQTDISKYNNISKLIDDYGMWVKLDAPGFPYWNMADSFKSEGWTLQSHNIIADKYGNIDTLTMFSSPDAKKHSSFGLIKHETGPEIVVLPSHLASGFKDLLNKIVAFFSQHSAAGPVYADVVLKNDRWEFRGVHMPLAEIMKIEQFLNKYR